VVIARLATSSIFAFELLRLDDFRRLGAGLLLSSVGAMGELVVLGWLALALTDSPFLVGVAMGARALPLFFVGVPAGALADRLPRHHLLIASGAGQALAAAAIGLCTLLGLVTLPILVLVTLAAGAFRGLEHAARQSYTHDVVGAASLVRGLAVLGVVMRAGWLLGSLGAGAVVAHRGSGVAYLAVAACYVASAAALLRVKAPARASSVHGACPGSLEASPIPRAKRSQDGGYLAPVSVPASLARSVVEFVALVRKDPMLLVLMILTAAAEVLGFSHQALLPSLARDVLHTGPEGLGALNAARSLGGMLGLAAAMRGAVRSSGALFLLVVAAFGISVAALGLAPYVVGFGGVLLVLTAANAGGALADLLAQSLLQLGVPAHLRGRAGGAWVVAIGLAPLGQLQIGALASLFGVSVAFGASGLALLALAGATAFLAPRLRRL
jgi:Major Facilitator Superfamily